MRPDLQEAKIVLQNQIYEYERAEMRLERDRLEARAPDFIKMIAEAKTKEEHDLLRLLIQRQGEADALLIERSFMLLEMLQNIQQLELKIKLKEASQ